jgi:hypothetical protein
VRQVRILHPFHPLCGQRFALVNVRHNWGEDRVDYRDAAGRLTSIPASWTDVITPDPVAAVSAGRSPFRLQDLVELMRLLQRLHDPVGAVPAREVRHA